MKVHIQLNSRLTVKACYLPYLQSPRFFLGIVRFLKLWYLEMNIDLLLEAAQYVEKRSDHDYCVNELRSDDSPSDGKSKRKLSEESKLRRYHNELERKRRADIRENLEILKKILPVDENDKRLSTVRLLNKASSYINLLRKKYRYIDFETQKLEIEVECLQEEINRYAVGNAKIKKILQEQGVITLGK